MKKKAHHHIMETMDSLGRSESLEDLMASVRIKAKTILRTHPKPNLDVVKKKVIEADLCMGSK